MADLFLHLPIEDRREALGVAADRSGRPAHLLEKDVWVVWALATLYGSALGEHLVFKGGTSLSKAYQVIRRFSEDVDLTYDIRAIAPDLVGDDGEALPETRSEEKRWSSEVRKRLPNWVEGSVQPIIADALAAEALAAAIRVEGEKLFIDYEAATAGSGYVARSVMLEFGARSTGEPASLRDIACDASGLIEGVTLPTARHMRDACGANLLGEGDGHPCLLPAGAPARRSLCSSLARCRAVGRNRFYPVRLC
ncbi:nucleotidyltransferase AbiEii toxin of type IV toxin-antitoxin system [Mesorhizobium loti]|uniref:Nucleotidyltransferase AbiEii toxin of type IV toxin-antitoxin system n=1 Tax=Rhizobium loti TaxID=381 RepID=A0A8E2WA47_RHILI|nr:nucleotidyltransferase AbiEii toxin of type IV toxin-antitoxin system [Mesorhizobium loti]